MNMDEEERAAILEVVNATERARTTLEERLALLEDKEAIRDVIVRFALLCDALRWGDPRRFDDLFELMDEDVERRLGGTLAQHAKGKPALRKVMEEPLLELKEEDSSVISSDSDSNSGRLTAYRRVVAADTRHLVADSVVRVNDDNSEAMAFAQYSVVKSMGQERGTHEGVWVMRLKRAHGEWKLRFIWAISNHGHNPLFKQEVVSITGQAAIA